MAGFPGGGNATRFRGVPLSTTPAVDGQVYLLTGGVWTPTTFAGGGLTSFNGRTAPDVVPTAGDYTAAMVGADVAGSAAAVLATSLQKSGGAMTGTLAMGGHPITQILDLAFSGFGGSTTPVRLVGGTSGGSPATGTYSTGDAVIDDTGAIWICTAGGTPGTWVSAGSGGGGGYASLTGAGESTSPGILDQAGGLSVNDSEGDGISLLTNAQVVIGSGNGTAITDNSANQIALEQEGDGGIGITSSGAGVLAISSQGGVNVEDASAGVGVQFNESGDGGITFGNSGAGGITLQDIGTAGIFLTATVGQIAANSANGISLINTTAGSVVISQGAVGGIAITDGGGSGISIGTTAGGGIGLNDSGGAGIFLESSGSVIVNGATVGLYAAAPVAQAAAIPVPSGGVVVDAESRAAIAAILDAIGAAAGGIGITA